MEHASPRTSVILPLMFALGSMALAGCGNKQPVTPATPPEVAATAGTADSATPQPLQATDATWTPEALEHLLAPIALYPDVVLGQVMVAAANPQEVLDAGNWKLQNEKLAGKELDAAASKLGFTPPIRGLLQSPEVLDMMCSEMDWTTELGQAYVNDQEGVLAAVQRLRAQAKDVGNLKSSEQMTVKTEVHEDKQIILVSPPKPEIVYVPQYDPVAAYAPPAPAPAPAAATPAPATTTTTTTTTGHSTSSMIMTGVLAFGAGMLVNEIFDDDDDWYHHSYYRPPYYGPPVYYRPPYPYRPVYGGGFYPGHGYHPPPAYAHHNTVVINNSNYFNHYENNSRGRNNVAINSPITAARPHRPELNSLNSSSRAAPRPAAMQSPADWKGQKTYAGARKPAANSSAREIPKVQGSYAGAPRNLDSRAGAVAGKPAVNRSVENRRAQGQDLQRPAGSNLSQPATDRAPAPRPANASMDRGRPTPDAAPVRTQSTAMSIPDRSGNERAAAERGRQSMGGRPARSGGGARPRR